MMDPTKDVKNILIAYDTAAKQIASCVKVFIRELYLQGIFFSLLLRRISSALNRVTGKVMRVGGIGDVSTKEKYRRHGLASKLLKVSFLTRRCNLMRCCSSPYNVCARCTSIWAYSEQSLNYLHFMVWSLHPFFEDYLLIRFFCRQGWLCTRSYDW
jgi:hypothetical protein